MKINRGSFDIHYELQGQGEPILFIQGVGVPGSGWRLQVQELSKHFQTLTYDNRGVGSSVPCREKITVELMAEDAVAVMKAAGVKSAHIVGHSLGGVIAAEIALSHREMVKSLTFVCTFASGKTGARVTPWVLWKSIRTRWGTKAMRRRAFLEMLFSEHFLNRVNRDEFAMSLVPLMGRDLAESPPILMKQLRALGRHNAEERLCTLKGIPTLVISAEHDGIAKPEYGRKIAECIPGARFELMEDAAHAVTIERPKDFNTRLTRFLRAHPHA